MSIAAIRSAFAAAAGGRLRLSHAGLFYQDSHQVLTFTGWHADGMPFAMATAPFDDSPVIRAGQVARDLIQAHTGSAGASEGSSADGGSALAAGPLPQSQPLAEPPPSFRRNAMSQKGSGLARLMGGLRSLDADADALATRLETAMTNLSAEMSTTTQIVGNVESSVNDLRSVNALYSNGAPNPTPGSSGPSQS